MIKSEKKYILAYGGLRDGLGAAEFYKDVGYFNFIEKVRIEDYSLYCINNKIPVIRPTINFEEDNGVTCDLMECDDETWADIYTEALRNDCMMVRLLQKSNWLQKTVPAFLFVYKNGVADSLKVKGGDWIRYILNRKPINNVNKEINKEEDCFIRSSN